MHTEYRRDMNHNYLILCSEESVDTTSYPIRMLATNMLHSLLKCHFQGMDGKVFFHYEITSRQSLTSLFEEKRLDFDSLQMIFGGFVQVMEEMAEYLLNPEQLVIEPEHMYLDLQNQKLQFCYLPGYERDVKKQFQALAEYILPKLEHKDERAVMLGYSVYRRAMEEDFHLEHVKEELYRVKGRNEEAAQVCVKKETHLEETKETDFPEFFMEERSSGRKNKEREKLQERKQLGIYAAVSAVLVLCMLGLVAGSLYGYFPQLRVETMLAVMILLLAIWVAVCFLIHKLPKKENWRERAEERKKQGEVLPYVPKETSCLQQEENFAAEQRKETLSKEVVFYEKSREDAGNTKLSCVDNEQEISGQKHIEYKEENESLEQEEYYGETVLLSEECHKGPASLVSREPGELATIYLEKDLTVIGKLELASDAVIPVATVSRVHAKIRKREDAYYLADLNSRNGTAVNGKMLPGGEEWLLQDGDEIDFAQARYIFLK